MDVTYKKMDTEKGSSPVLFREVQKMNQTWIWIIVSISVILIWYEAYQQLFLGKHVGTNPPSNWITFILFLIFGILFPLLFYSIKLVTEVRKNGLYVRFYPFHLAFKTFPFEVIQNYEIQTYNPIRDYGGWGIRYRAKGKAYTTSGNRGVLIKYLDGTKMKKLMIGSQNPEKLFEAIGIGIKSLSKN